jgi:hypothetical protein
MVEGRVRIPARSLRCDRRALMGSTSKSPPQAQAPATTSGSFGDVRLDTGRGAKYGAPTPTASAGGRLYLGAGGVGVGSGVAGGRSGVGSACQRGRNRVAIRRPTSVQLLDDRAVSCGDDGAPRGIRTPNRQIRSQPSPVPARLLGPSSSPLVLVNGHDAGPSRASVPVFHAWLGRKLVAVSGRCCQTRCLVTGRSPGPAE